LVLADCKLVVAFDYQTVEWLPLLRAAEKTRGLDTVSIGIGDDRHVRVVSKGQAQKPVRTPTGAP
jgi:hypothetical protein